MTELEQRVQTGFRENPSDDPGIVVTDEGHVVIVGPDGSRALAQSIKPSATAVSLPAGAAAAQRFLVPYDGDLVNVAITPNEDIDFTSGSRTWTLTRAEGEVFAEGTFDIDSPLLTEGVMLSTGQYPLALTDPVPFLNVGEVLTLSTSGDANDGAGVLAAAQFLDPPVPESSSAVSASVDAPYLVSGFTVESNARIAAPTAWDGGTAALNFLLFGVPVQRVSQVLAAGKKSAVVKTDDDSGDGIAVQRLPWVADPELVLVRGGVAAPIPGLPAPSSLLGRRHRHDALPNVDDSDYALWPIGPGARGMSLIAYGLKTPKFAFAAGAGAIVTKPGRILVEGLVTVQLLCNGSLVGIKSSNLGNYGRTDMVNGQAWAATLAQPCLPLAPGNSKTWQVIVSTQGVKTLRPATGRVSSKPDHTFLTTVGLQVEPDSAYKPGLVTYGP